MQFTLPSFGFAALITTICLNTLGLIGLRGYSLAAEHGLLILMLGYTPMALGVFVSRKHQAASQVSAWPWMSAWAASVVSIYVLFLFFPAAISVSQLIIAQSLTPLLAVIATGDYRSKVGRREPLRRLIPLSLLFALAWIQYDFAMSPNGFAGFFAICAAFLITHTSMRRLARLQKPLWVLPRFASIVILFISAVLLWRLPAVNLPTENLLPLGAAAGVLLILVQAGYLFGLAKTAPFLSAIAISSSVPIAILFDWLLSGREVQPLEAVLAMFYCLSMVVIATGDTRRSQQQGSTPLEPTAAATTSAKKAA